MSFIYSVRVSGVLVGWLKTSEEDAIAHIPGALEAKSPEAFLELLVPTLIPLEDWGLDLVPDAEYDLVDGRLHVNDGDGWVLYDDWEWRVSGAP